MGEKGKLREFLAQRVRDKLTRETRGRQSKIFDGLSRKLSKETQKHLNEIYKRNGPS